jgi:chemotaxis response regulator CheB
MTSTKPVPAGPIRVVVVDADDLVRQTVAALLDIGDRIEVVGIAGQVGPALELVRTADPDVVVVDPRMPDLDDGLAFIRRLHAAPTVRVLVVGSAGSWPGRPGRWCRSVGSEDLPPARPDRGCPGGQPVGAGGLTMGRSLLDSTTL